MWIGKVGEYETVHPGDDGAPGGEHPHPEGDVHRKKACHRGLRELLKNQLTFYLSQKVHLDFLDGYRTDIPDTDTTR